MNASPVKPPRYLLREAMLLSMLDGLPPGRFLEIGHGSGNMLRTLAEAGYWGDGYDFSEAARASAGRVLSSTGITNVTLLAKPPEQGPYDYIFFFEVIGYWKDPVREMEGLKKLLSPTGKLVFSFTKKESGGYAEKVTGDMACFTRQEIVGMLEDDLDLKVRHILNYGFPLSNVLKPILNLLYYLKCRSGNAGRDLEADVKKSGMAGGELPIRLASLVINKTTVLPFTKLQRLFRNSDLGTGYLVMAERR